MTTQIYELTESDMKKIRRGQDSVRYYQGLGQGALDLANELPSRIKINEDAECENDFQRGYFIGYNSPNNLQHMIELNPNFSDFKTGVKKLPKLDYRPKHANFLWNLPIAYQNLYNEQVEKFFGIKIPNGANNAK